MAVCTMLCKVSHKYYLSNGTPCVVLESIVTVLQTSCKWFSMEVKGLNFDIRNLDKTTSCILKIRSWG